MAEVDIDLNQATLTDSALCTLREQGFPTGLASEVLATKDVYPIRFWIIDNSGYVKSCRLSTERVYLFSSHCV